MHKRIVDPFVFLDSDHILYSVGRKVMITGPGTREMMLLPEHEARVKRIVSLAISPNKKYLAISELLDNYAQVSTSTILLYPISPSRSPQYTYSLSSTNIVIRLFIALMIIAGILVQFNYPQEDHSVQIL